LLAALIAVLIGHSYVRRMSRLKATAERVLDEASPGLTVPPGDDELGALTRSLERVAPQIRELLDKLRMEVRRREAILGSMVEGVLAVDRERRVTFYNDSFARLIGARDGIVEGSPLLNLVRDPGLVEMLTGVLISGEPRKRRLQLAAAEGRSFEVQASPLAMPAESGAIAILHDVTELERLERIRKDFVANVSHELRTPLAAIRGYAETLLDGALDDAQNRRKFVEVIEAHAIRLNNIASDLLVLSELDSGKQVSRIERVPVRSSLEAALRTVESEAKVRDVALIAGEVQDLEILGYTMRLEQTLVNLLGNAVKFNRPHGEVRFEAVRTDGKVRIRISDTGIGIPSEDLPRIFERFYRVDKARSRQVGGTGLGLSIVKHAVEQMNGTISVESRLGQGSSFTLLFPAG
jgi:two-component system phosphate regulon sensor histidine kinase PhoR